MQREPTAKLRGRVGLILLVAAAAAVWWGLDRAEPRTDWLRVEAPRRAVAGQPLPMRVHLASGLKPVPVRRSPLEDFTGHVNGMSGHRRFQSSGQRGRDLRLRDNGPSRAGLRFVIGIIYLSRTGSWEHHTLVAGTEVIPVSSNTVGKVESRLEQLRLQPPGDDPSAHPHSSATRVC